MRTSRIGFLVRAVLLAAFAQYGAVFATVPVGDDDVPDGEPVGFEVGSHPAGVGNDAGQPNSQQHAFVENLGQWDSRLLYFAALNSMRVRVEANGVALFARGLYPDRTGHLRDAVVRLSFDDDANGVERRNIVGADRLPGMRHYFLGSSPGCWTPNVPSFASVVFQGAWSGVDVRFGVIDGSLQFDLALEPGVDPETIRMRWDGVVGLDVDIDGDLVVTTPIGPLHVSRPIAWQVESDGSARPVEIRYAIKGSRHFGFEVLAPLDGARQTIIDPGITWATYLGGSLDESVNTVRRLPDGSVLVAGTQCSPGFPWTPGVFEIGPTPSCTPYVSCFEEDGSALVFSTFFGGSVTGNTGLATIARDDTGRFAFGGTTDATDLPTTPGAYSSAFGGGLFDAYVAMISDDGSQLVYSTYLPGACQEAVRGVAVESSGSLIVAGTTCSTDYPPGTPGAFDPAHSGFGDGFLARLDPDRVGVDQLSMLTYLGSADSDEIRGLELISSGAMLVWGLTYSADFPVTAGAWDTTFTVPGEAFAAILSQDGSTLLTSSFIFGDVLAVGPDGTITAAGTANNTGLPVTPGAYDTTWNGSSDAYALRFDAALSQVEWCTYLGSTWAEGAFALDVGEDGSVLLTGQTSSPAFPTTPFAPDKSFSFGLADPFVARLSADGSQLLYSTYLGSSSNGAAQGSTIAFDGAGHALAGGFTTFPDFPVTPGAYDTTYNGGGDVYVARLDLQPPWTDVGGGLAGTAGLPKLTATGWPEAGEAVSLRLTGAKPVSPVTLVIGLELLVAPFKGGTLVPAPDLLLAGLLTGPTGALILSGTWPAGIPSGFEASFQHWVTDPAGPQGLAASNGLVVLVP